MTLRQDIGTLPPHVEVALRVLECHNAEPAAENLARAVVREYMADQPKETPPVETCGECGHYIAVENTGDTFGGCNVRYGFKTKPGNDFAIDCPLKTPTQ